METETPPAGAAFPQPSARQPSPPRYSPRMSIAEHIQFDFTAMHAAVDEQRRARGLAWTALAEETRPSGGHARRRVTATTLSRSGQQRAMEADGVLMILAWLRRTFEDFTNRNGPRATPSYDAVEPTKSDDMLRFDLPQIHAALDARRSAQDLTWREVADEIGWFQPNGLTRMKTGGRTGVPTVLWIAEWLEVAPETLTSRTDW